MTKKPIVEVYPFDHLDFQSSEKLLLIDRDGTLNFDLGYTHLISDLEIIPQVVPALREVSSRGIPIIVITNQSGVGRGLYTLTQMKKFNRALASKFLENGVTINAVISCTHTPEDECLCRKPKTLSFELASEIFPKSRICFVGDADSDCLAAAKRAIDFIKIDQNRDYEQIADWARN